MPVLTAAKARAAAAWNQANHERARWSLHFPPGGGRPVLFLNEGDESFAEWAAVIQQYFGSRETDGPVDGKVGPLTVALFGRLASDALRDGSAQARQEHVGWKLMDYVALPRVEPPQTGPGAEAVAVPRPLSDAAARAAAVWNLANHTRLGWFLYATPAGGRPDLYDSEGDPLFAQSVAAVQRDHLPGLVVDGKLGPLTVEGFQRLVEASQGSGEHIGGVIRDYVRLPGRGSAGAGGESRKDPPAPSPKPTPAKKGSKTLIYGGAGAVAVLAGVLAARKYGKKGKKAG